MASEDTVTAHGSAESGSYQAERVGLEAGEMWRSDTPRSGRILHQSKDHFPGGRSCLKSDLRGPKGTMTTPSDSFNPWGGCQQFPLHLGGWQTQIPDEFAA